MLPEPELDDEDDPADELDDDDDDEDESEDLAADFELPEPEPLEPDDVEAFLATNKPALSPEARRFVAAHAGSQRFIHRTSSPAT